MSGVQIDVKFIFVTKDKKNYIFRYIAKSNIYIDVFTQMNEHLGRDLAGYLTI